MDLLGLARRRVLEQRRRGCTARERPVVTYVGPQPASAALPLGEHRHRGVVRVDALGTEHVRLDRVPERLQRRGRRADPVGERGHVELHTLVGVDDALTIERQVRAVFAVEDVREQLRSGPAARDRMRRCGRLQNRVAAPAGQPLPHVHDGLPLRRHAFQRLGRVLAELAEGRALTARTDGWPRVDAALAWQRLRKRPTRRLDGLLLDRRCGGCNRLRRLRLGRFLDQLRQLQLQLIELGRML